MLWLEIPYAEKISYLDYWESKNGWYITIVVDWVKLEHFFTDLNEAEKKYKAIRKEIKKITKKV